MSLIYSLSIECGSKKEFAMRVCRYFDNFKVEIKNTPNQINNFFVTTSIFQDIENNWWSIICPFSKNNIDISDNLEIMTQLSQYLYQNLRNSPPFRYALAGVEVDEFRTYSELIEDIIELDLPGLVISNDIYNRLKSSSKFCFFNERYVWQPLAHILQISDSPIVKRDIRSMFEKLGYSVDTVNNINEVYQDKESQNYDFIFLDISIPNLDGYQVLKHLRSHINSSVSKDIPIVLLSSNMILSSVPGKKNEYITKPFTQEELLYQLRNGHLKSITDEVKV